MVHARPIRRLLIANRGEIAVRIARTAHRMGIDTVGVYSEPDANGLHVDVVDVAVALCGATPADSYLRGDAVIAAAVRTGCDSVHPGYGFLAENVAFARQVIEAGLTWVGPTPDQMAALGNKVTAKRTARAAGVPTGSMFEANRDEIPDEVPMPALVKAAAGGGGRGMRLVRDAAELGEAVAAATREAESAFGDGTVFVEPYVERGRHIEVQIIGDRHGNVIHLGERECSVQRRHQKVLEESPAPGIASELRAALCEGAVALARHVGYEGVGTVEFLVGAGGAVQFLEVNTRLQVEHPVTEAVTGLDLVELQLRCAAGEPLPVTQEDVRFTGHAIEARIVAEDPRNGWLPSTGRIGVFDLGDAARVDTGVRSGSIVAADYDSLLAKVVVHAPSRREAAHRMHRTLRTAAISGVSTNLNCLAATVAEPDFVAGNVTTAYLDEHPDVVASTGPTGELREALLLAAVFAQEQRDRAANGVTGFAPSGWRNLRTTGQRSIWVADEVEHHVELFFEGGSAASALVGQWPLPGDDGSLPADERRRAEVRLLERDDDRQVLEIDGMRHVVDVAIADSHVVARSSLGSAVWVQVPRFVVHDAEEGGSGPLCPLPGTVVSVHVSASDAVTDGTVLMVVEAMKMEHSITASGPGIVAEVLFAEGDRVDAGDLLVRLAPVD